MLCVGEHRGALEHFKHYAEVAPITVIEITEEGKSPFLSDVIHVSSLEVGSLFDRVDGLKCVLVDVSCKLALEILRDAKTKGINGLVLYDNRESFVPGEYNQAVRKVFESNLASGWVFSSAALKCSFQYELDGEIVSVDPAKYGSVAEIGYVNLSRIEIIRELRKSKEELKSEFLTNQGFPIDSTLITYLGAANTPYFEEALPNFLGKLEAAIEHSEKKVVLLLQQHPRAKIQYKNTDWELILSRFKENPNVFIVALGDELEPHLAMCDFSVYFQTSVAGEAAAAGVPVLQIGDVLFPEKLVQEGKIRSGLKLGEVLENPSVLEGRVTVNDLGFDINYVENLNRLLFSVGAI